MHKERGTSIHCCTLAQHRISVCVNFIIILSYKDRLIVTYIPELCHQSHTEQGWTNQLVLMERPTAASLLAFQHKRAWSAAKLPYHCKHCCASYLDYSVMAVAAIISVHQNVHFCPCKAVFFLPNRTVPLLLFFKNVYLVRKVSAW